MVAEAQKKKILIAEDERAIAGAMKLKLEHEGYEVHVAANGKKALEWLADNKADLILLDMVMPTMDGFEFLEELKKKGKKVTVLATSNLSQEEDMKRAKSLGAKDFFVKSNTPLSKLVEEIKKTI